MGRRRANTKQGFLFPLPSLCTAKLHGQGSMKEASAKEREELFVTEQILFHIFSADLTLNAIILKLPVFIPL